MSAAALLALLLAGIPARAQDDPAAAEGRKIEEVDEEAALRDAESSLKSDPASADALAARIARSTIAARITGSTDDRQRLKDIREWIDRNTGLAAGLAVGLGRDDARGTRDFERAFSQKADTYHQFSLDKQKGIFGRLRKSGADSKLMKAEANKDLADEEQREILKTLFEGRGSGSNQIVNQKPTGKPSEPAAAANGALSSNYYDRLSQSNIRGYSPQLQAMQSALNARRAPGAPKLIETGKLDYATLSYPGYSLKFDVANLERRLTYERNYALAKLLGLEGKYKPEQLADHALAKELEAKAAAAGKSLSPRFERRRAALEKAAAVTRAFDQEALAAKDPSKISRALLVSLGAKQREAARWITVASLEDELERLEAYAGFMDAALLQAVDACPVDDSVRASYKRRGEGFGAQLKRLTQGDQDAVKALESDAWLEKLPAVDASLGELGAVRKDLLRNIDLYRGTAYALSGERDGRPAWRRFVDGWIQTLLPSSSYAKTLKSRFRRRDVLADGFAKIAMGHLDAAYTALADAGAR